MSHDDNDIPLYLREALYWEERIKKVKTEDRKGNPVPAISSAQVTQAKKLLTACSESYPRLHDKPLSYFDTQEVRDKWFKGHEAKDRTNYSDKSLQDMRSALKAYIKTIEIAEAKKIDAVYGERINVPVGRPIKTAKGKVQQENKNITNLFMIDIQLFAILFEDLLELVYYFKRTRIILKGQSITTSKFSIVSLEVAIRKLISWADSIIDENGQRICRYEVIDGVRKQKPLIDDFSPIYDENVLIKFVEYRLGTSPAKRVLKELSGLLSLIRSGTGLFSNLPLMKAHFAENSDKNNYALVEKIEENVLILIPEPLPLKVLNENREWEFHKQPKMTVDEYFDNLFYRVTNMIKVRTTEENLHDVDEEMETQARLRNVTGPTALREVDGVITPIDPSELLWDICETIYHFISTDTNLYTKQNWKDSRVVAMMTILLNCPMRISNLMLLRHVPYKSHRAGDYPKIYFHDMKKIWCINVPAGYVKNKKAILCDMPQYFNKYIDAWANLKDRLEISTGSHKYRGREDHHPKTGEILPHSRFLKFLNGSVASKHLQNYVHSYSPDLFPEGINPHAFRTCVATSCKLRGLPMQTAMALLQDSEEIVKTVYMKDNIQAFLTPWFDSFGKRTGDNTKDDNSVGINLVKSNSDEFIPGKKSKWKR